MTSSSGPTNKVLIKARIRDFQIPPVHDGLVLGRHSPIGCVAIRKALDLLASSPFEHIELDDEIISDILVRKNILRRVPQEKLIEFVLKNVKPLMASDDLLHLDLDIEAELEQGNL